MLLFLLGLGRPILCQDCSKLSGTGEAFISASVLPAANHRGAVLIWGEPEHRWFACLIEEEVEVWEGDDP